MKKQFTKIKIAAENLSRSNKQDRKDYELETIEKQVEKYREVLDKMVRKLPAVSTATDTQERDKRIKKNSHYKIGQALEESSKELSKDMPLHHVLSNCGELEKSIAECIVDSELETETEVVRRLKLILDNEMQEISAKKRNVSRTIQEYTSLKRSYETAIRLDEPQQKINHIKEQQEQCEVKLEKERDSWAAQMFELIAKEDVIVQCIRDYVLNQRNYHERALHKVNSSLAAIQDVIQSTVKSRFGTSLTEHLASTNREISYILELCICCLLENGLYEEGLLRVGCANTKLRRMKHALEAQYVKTPLPLDYQDPHVIGSILKLYLRELPEPLLTYKYYKEFIHAADRSNDAERKAEIKVILAKLPAANYVNLRYLTKFLWLVTQYVEQNKMSSQNLAIVMSPNMLWPRMDKNNPADYLGQVNSSSAVNVIIELLISHWDYFFDGEVDFFVTLQRSKLFVESKSKSSSSNENLDRHDGDSADSPRYGTIRRQKACAPSPPAKTYEKAQNNAGNHNSNISVKSVDEVAHVQKNGEMPPRLKDLFPHAGNYSQSADKPEKPPLPKLPLFPAQPQQEAPELTPKPVPMTRTQFFGLDNLPSPLADRKSSDSVNSLTLKPDLPQKPKIPKRPIVLNLNAGSGSGSKSDDETATPTGNNSEDGGGATGGVSFIKQTTEKFIDKMRNDSCDSNATGAAARENNHNHSHSQQQLHTVQNTNANNASAIATRTAGSADKAVDSTAATATSTSTATPAASITVSGTMTAATTTTLRSTPTTPISPNIILTPKRPTVPAPPPPSVIKKQTE